MALARGFTDGAEVRLGRSLWLRARGKQTQMQARRIKKGQQDQLEESKTEEADQEVYWKSLIAESSIV